MGTISRNTSKQSQIRRLFFVACAMLSSFFLRAEEPPSKGWKPIFNGTDFSGWKITGNRSAFTIVNGQLKATIKPGESEAYLMTETQYTDFFLELECKAENVETAFLQVRSRYYPAKNKLHGPRYGIGNLGPMAGSIYVEEKGIVYPADLNAGARQAFKKDGWNKIRIECIGNHLVTFINGVPAASVIDAVHPKGRIALGLNATQHGSATGTIYWKNIQLRTDGVRLSAAPNLFVVNLIPNQLSEAERKAGIKLLWDGRTSAGWRRAYRSTFPPKGWTMENGILTIQAGYGNRSTEGGGDISTTGKYGHFVLQFEFKLTPEANSGVKYFVADTAVPLPSVLGLEYQLLDDEKNADARNGTNGNRKLGALYDLIAPDPAPEAKRPVGAWNRGMIIAYPDNTVQHWVNGWKVVEYKRDSPFFESQIATSKYKDISGFGMAPEGYISLQDHGYEVSFRSIKIKEIKAGEMTSPTGSIQ